ncbi:unnamed protein product [Diamesa serratosioi]
MSELFIVLPPLTKNNSIIYGRNSLLEDSEIIFNEPEANSGNPKCKNIEVNSEAAVAVILNGNCGANEKNVSMSVIFEENSPENGLSATDITRLTLERSDSAEKSIESITNLISTYNPDSVGGVETFPKYSFLICDNNDVYILDVVEKYWAAEKMTEGFRAFSSGLSVKTKIDKQSENLVDKLKELGVYDGTGELNFSQVFSSEIKELKWPSEDGIADSSFSAQMMFEVLRAGAEGKEINSSFVSVLKQSGSSSVHWFTGTENPSESVFKPFIFTPNVRISPLTQKGEEDTETLLRKLHSNRKWEMVGELLKSLEKSCVDEIDGYVDDCPTPELDELLKDCVEAEVKFYR